MNTSDIMNNIKNNFARSDLFFYTEHRDMRIFPVVFTYIW